MANPAYAEGQPNIEQQQNYSKQTRLNNPRLYQPSCQSPESTEEADLCAQREMAKAARDLYDISVKQFWVGIFGLFALGLTIYLTRRAVNAADTANLVSREASVIELQAYVDVEAVSIAWWEGSKPICTVKVRNAGQTPARWYGYRCNTIIGQSPSVSFDRDKIYDLDLTKWYGFAAKSSLTFDFADEEFTATLAKANAEDKPIRIDGVIEYETYFGEIFFSEFSFFGIVYPNKRITMKMFPTQEMVVHKPFKLSRSTQALTTFFLIKKREAA